MWPGLAENRIYKSQKNVELGCKEKDECDMQDGVQKTGSQEKGNQRGRNSKGKDYLKGTAKWIDCTSFKVYTGNLLIVPSCYKVTLTDSNPGHSR